LSPVHTVAEKCDCRRKRRDNGDSLTFLRQCGQAFSCVYRRRTGTPRRRLQRCGLVDRSMDNFRSSDIRPKHWRH